MTYQSFVNEGYLLTEAERQAIDATIVEQYRIALNNINDKIAAMIAKAREAGIKPADQYNWMIQYNRLDSLKAQIYDEYKKLGGTVRRLQIEAFDLSFSNQYYRTAFQLDWSEPLTFSPLDPNLVRYAMTGEIEAWKAIKAEIGNADNYTPVAGTLKSLIATNQDKAIQDIWAQVNAGLINGEGITDIAKRIKTVMGGVYDGQVFGDLYKALRIAHTEGHRAQNMAELARSYEAQEAGVSVQKMWDATLDNAVRPEHAALDGVRVPLDGTWDMAGYKVSHPGDPSLPGSLTINCRCHSVTVTDNYEPTARRGRNPVTGKNEFFSYKTFEAWAKEKGLVKNKYGRMYVQRPA
jgi:hypothetical protein